MNGKGEEREEGESTVVERQRIRACEQMQRNACDRHNGEMLGVERRKGKKIHRGVTEEGYGYSEI